MHVYIFFKKISMSAHCKHTTALQVANALIWTDHLTVNVNQDSQEMGKHARVVQEYILFIYLLFVYFYITIY